MSRLTIYDRLSYLKQRVENPNVSLEDKCDIIEFFMKYNIIFNQGLSIENFFKDIEKLTENIGGADG
tara:strand:- start:429 stop:629 length:201 start_codon:yes stop_codon:yes gene_type:complete